MPMPYAGDEIAAALAASSRTWDFRFERLAKDGSTYGAAELARGTTKITHAALADKIKRSITGALNPDQAFDFLSDRLRVFTRLQMLDGDWQEWPLGTFLLASNETPRGTRLARETRGFTGFDLLQVLVEDCVIDRYVVASGTAVITAAATVLTSAGFTTNALATSALTLPAAMEWEPGTSKLQIVNDLLATINYKPLSMTPYGVPIAGPYVDPAAADVLWSYTLDTASLVRPGTRVTLDLFSVPNVVVGVLSEPERAPLVATATNSNPASPLSTVRRGRSIVQLIDSQGAVDLTTLQAKVDRVLTEQGQQYESIVFDTGLMPFHDDGDVVLFDDGSGAVRYRETGWEMELRAGGVMRHNARRVVILG